MTGGAGEKAAAWVYRGVWGVLTDLMDVPEAPPNTPPGSGEIYSLKPSPGFLRYLKWWFWVLGITFDVALIAAWVIVCVVQPWVGFAIAPIVWGIAIIPDIIGYIALHLRWDTTWYVITDRCVRIRRGIWLIQESTITFENIQNVTISQGPMQRRFGIADLVIQTAGGGASDGRSQGLALHKGLLEGIEKPEELRNMFLARAGLSQSAGLGDEHPHQAPGLSPRCVGVLEEIRDLLQATG